MPTVRTHGNTTVECVVNNMDDKMGSEVDDPYALTPAYAVAEVLWHNNGLTRAYWV